MMQTLLRLHRAGRLERDDYLFLASIAAIWLVLLYLAGLILWAIGAPIYDCSQSADCWGGM